MTHTIRACYLCKHANIHDDKDLSLICDSPNVATAPYVAKCREARADAGPCGPEARFLEIVPSRAAIVAIERQPHDPT